MNFDVLPDPICIIDVNHRFTSVNRAMAERFGTTPAQMIGLPCYESVHGLPAPPPYCPHRELLEDGKEHSAEVYLANLQGHFLVTVSPRMDRYQRLLGSVHVARDITTRKMAENAMSLENQLLNEQLSKMAKELEIRNRNLEEAMISLEVIMAKADDARRDLEKSLLANVKQIVLPCIRSIENSGLDQRQALLIRKLKILVEDIVSPFAHRMSDRYLLLTPAEIRVADMVKDGFQAKEIADILQLSPGTVNTHKANIRKKLGLTGNKISLRAYLHSIT